MVETPPVPSPKRRAKFVIGGATIAFVLVGLVVWAMARPGATAFYVTPSELLAMDASGAASDFRVSGKVVPGTIERDGLETAFAVTDGDTSLTVVTDRPLPDAFKDGSEVIARGRLEGTTFAATEVLAKCPSKFKAKVS